MTDLIRDPRLIRVYWLLDFYLEGQHPLYVEGQQEIGWQLGERTLWCFVGEGNSLHLADSVLGTVISPDRPTLKRWIREFLGVVPGDHPEG